MERTSLITRLLISEADNFDLLDIIDEIPTQASLDTYFLPAPLILEQADLKESSKDSEQGELIERSARANIHRDSDFYKQWIGKELLLYIETANGERHFIGSDEIPVLYSYSRDSGSGNSDSRSTAMIFSQTIPYN
ncbi:hypothetical protein [Belliella pelovolcani]|uniref:hypothetical protein n=1 Tax=Belliella pelovolcani TaxID=529505 RepID=UPI00391935A6